MTAESQAEVTGHMQILRRCNPFGLWCIIEDTHLSLRAIMNARTQLVKLKASSMTSYTLYAKKFTSLVKILQRGKSRSETELFQDKIS